MTRPDDDLSKDGILQQPAEGDPATIDRELARKDGGNSASPDREKDKPSGTDVHDTIRKAMDEAAPQTGVRPGP